MENKLLLLLIVITEVGISVLCETDSFGPIHNEKLNPGNLDLEKRKDFYIFDRNELTPEAKNLAKRPAIFKERYSQPSDTVNSLEIHQDTTKTNFTEKETERHEFHQNGYNNWQNEKSRFFYPNRQENYQNTFPGQTFNRRINPQTNNQWDWNGNFYQNSQSQWNEEENFHKYQAAAGVRNENYDKRIADVPNIGKPVIYSNNRNTNSFGEPLIKGEETNGYFQFKNVVPENKFSLTLLNDDEMKRMPHYNHEMVKNPLKSQLNSKINYYYSRNADDFRNPNFYNPEKGVVINFNTECPTTKPTANPIFQKFILAPKPRVPQADVPTFQIPETTVITRHEMSTPIYYL